MKTREPGHHIHIGLDDIDSRYSGCTTYTSTLIVRKLLREGAVFTDYPNLIRLNPNIPWKTKGNGAVALRFRHENPEKLFKIVVNAVEEKSETEDDIASPGMVMLISKSIPEQVRQFAGKALSDVLSKKLVIKLIDENRMLYKTLGGGRGLIGSVAAIGNTLTGDHTYELLAYRRKENWGTERRVDTSSILYMDTRTGVHTFNNYDHEKKRVLITPRGPDPVLLGIRGETPESVFNALNLLKIFEPIDSYITFRTNQGTGEHLREPLDPHVMKAYSSRYFHGQILEAPHIEIGGHVYFKVGVNGVEVDCAIYEPAGSLRKTALELMIGDVIEVGGGVRRGTSNHPKMLNIEYLRVLKMVEKTVLSNPFCRVCGSRMKSQGRRQPVRCGKCGFEDSQAGKIMCKEDRNLAKGLYLPPSGSQRHLTKPLQRYGLERRWVKLHHPTHKKIVMSTDAGNIDS